MADKTYDQTILKLWECGWSKGRIAEALFMTRGQVSGKLFRLDAPKREGKRRPLLDLTGRRFGRWLVLDRAENSPRGDTFWRCRCDCGTVRAIWSRHLRRGGSQSCGCLRAYVLRERAA